MIAGDFREEVTSLPMDTIAGQLLSPRYLTLK
jgi:hypothetical protein